jgi:predicted PurR-regulated permease PerM
MALTLKPLTTNKKAGKHLKPIKPLTTNQKVWAFMAAIFLILCGIVVTLFYFRDIFIVLLVGICFISLVDKARRIFNKYTTPFTQRQKYSLSIALILLSSSILIYLLLIQIEHILTLFLALPNLQEMLTRGLALVLEFMEVLPEAMVDELGHYIDNMFNQTGTLLTTVVSQMLYYALCVILIYPILISLYFKEREKIHNKITGLVPVQFKKDFEKTTSAIMFQTNNYFTAKIIETLTVTIISCIGFYLIGLPGWLFFGIIMGLLNNIPYIGPVIASIPPMIIGLAIGWKIALLALVVCAIVQIIDNAFIVPVMISGKMSLNPLTTVLLILTFAQLFGPLGMILSIPIYFIFRIVLTESYQLLTHIFPEFE